MLFGTTVVVSGLSFLVVSSMQCSVQPRAGIIAFFQTTTAVAVGNNSSVFILSAFSRRQLILNRAAPTLVRSLESGQSRGVLQETSTIAVASIAKQFVGDLVEEGVYTYGRGAHRVNLGGESVGLLMGRRSHDGHMVVPCGGDPIGYTVCGGVSMDRAHLSIPGQVPGRVRNVLKIKKKNPKIEPPPLISASRYHTKTLALQIHGVDDDLVNPSHRVQW